MLNTCLHEDKYKTKQLTRSLAIIIKQSLKVSTLSNNNLFPLHLNKNKTRLQHKMGAITPHIFLGKLLNKGPNNSIKKIINKGTQFSATTKYKIYP